MVDAHAKRRRGTPAAAQPAHHVDECGAAGVPKCWRQQSPHGLAQRRPRGVAKQRSPHGLAQRGLRPARAERAADARAQRGARACAISAAGRPQRAPTACAAAAAAAVAAGRQQPASACPERPLPHRASWKLPHRARGRP
eukprot:356187-Chlamydomonas_euryale.AAC.1